MMRTNIVLDDSLVKEAFLLSGVKTKKDLISLALKEFVMTRKRRNLLKLAGNIEFRDDYDYKACREGK
jgi:Arc/MetJ family transcription regulator